jgi:hypothetical protein
LFSSFFFVRGRVYSNQLLSLSDELIMRLISSEMITVNGRMKELSLTWTTTTTTTPPQGPEKTKKQSNTTIFAADVVFGAGGKARQKKGLK